MSLDTTTDRDWLWKHYDYVGTLASCFAARRGRPELAEYIKSRALEALLRNEYVRQRASPKTYIWTVVKKSVFAELRREAIWARGALKIAAAEVGANLEAQVIARDAVERDIAKRYRKATPRMQRKAVHAARQGNFYLALVLIGFPVQLCALLLFLSGGLPAALLHPASSTPQAVLAAPLGWVR
jgi:hypothetical protein